MIIYPLNNLSCIILENILKNKNLSVSDRA